MKIIVLVIKMMTDVEFYDRTVYIDVNDIGDCFNFDNYDCDVIFIIVNGVCRFSIHKENGYTMPVNKYKIHNSNGVVKSEIVEICDDCDS